MICWMVRNCPSFISSFCHFDISNLPIFGINFALYCKMANQLTLPKHCTLLADYAYSCMTYRLYKVRVVYTE